MEVKLAILRPFFENPHEQFHIREIAKLTNINHTTVRKYLQQFMKEGILSIKKEKLYDSYAANTIVEQYLNLKIYFNLEKIRLSGITDKLSKHYAMPSIVVFGEYAKAFDNKESIIGICIIKTVNSSVKEFELQSFYKNLQREIQLYVYTQKEFSQLKKTNPALLNEIYNGIVLRGKINYE